MTCLTRIFCSASVQLLKRCVLRSLNWSDADLCGDSKWCSTVWISRLCLLYHIWLILFEVLIFQHVHFMNVWSNPLVCHTLKEQWLWCRPWISSRGFIPLQALLPAQPNSDWIWEGFFWRDNGSLCHSFIQSCTNYSIRVWFGPWCLLFTVSLAKWRSMTTSFDWWLDKNPAAQAAHLQRLFVTHLSKSEPKNHYQQVIFQESFQTLS